MGLQLGNGIEADYKEGKLVVSVAVASVVVPKLDEIRAKVESGEIDLIKGTDIEKGPLLLAIDFLKAELLK